MRQMMMLAGVLGALTLVPVPGGAADKTDRAGDKAASGTRDTANDSWLTAKTKIALFADERVIGRQVDVDTKDGVVSLRGKVDTEEARNAAAEVARRIEGIKDVRNDLQVVPRESRKVVAAKDDFIKKQIENDISRDAQLKAAKIEVRSDAGVVTLTGKAPSLVASARASEIAHKAEGVRSVNNSLSVEYSQR